MRFMKSEERVKRLSKEQQEMIVCNMNLVYSVIHKFKGMGIAWGDLVTIGKLGLMSGVLSYNPSREGAEATKGTLLYNSIEGFIINALKKENRKGFTIGKALVMNSIPGVKEEEDEFKLSAKAKKLERSLNRGVSLNAPMTGPHGEESDSTYGDVITIKNLDERLEERIDVNRHVRLMVSKYITNSNELKVMKHVFAGMSIPQIAKIWWRDDSAKTQEERAKGVSYQSVQACYDRVVEKLRDVSEKEFLW